MLETVLHLISAKGIVSYRQGYQWRIKGGADWATAKGPQLLGGPQSLSR